MCAHACVGVRIDILYKMHVQTHTHTRTRGLECLNSIFHLQLLVKLADIVGSLALGDSQARRRIILYSVLEKTAESIPLSFQIVRGNSYIIMEPNQLRDMIINTLMGYGIKDFVYFEECLQKFKNMFYHQIINRNNCLPNFLFLYGDSMLFLCP